MAPLPLPFPFPLPAPVPESNPDTGSSSSAADASTGSSSGSGSGVATASDGSGMSGYMGSTSAPYSAAPVAAVVVPVVLIFGKSFGLHSRCDERQLISSLSPSLTMHAHILSHHHPCPPRCILLLPTTRVDGSGSYRRRLHLQTLH